MNLTLARYAIALLSCTVVLEACSSDSDDNATTAGSTTSFSPASISGEVMSVGTITVAQLAFSDDGAEVDINAEFFNSPELVSASDIATGFTGLAGECAINDATAAGMGLETGTLEPTNTGEVIIVSSPGGTFATLFLGPDDTYSLEGFELPETAPAGLTLDSTGGEFSALSSVPVPGVDPVTGLDAGGTPITAMSTLTWDAGSNPENTLILIAAFTDDDDPDSVICFTADSGEFSFPSDIQAALGDDFIAPDASFARLVIDLIVNDDELLIVSNGTSIDVDTDQ